MGKKILDSFTYYIDKGIDFKEKYYDEIIEETCKA